MRDRRINELRILHGAVSELLTAMLTGSLLGSLYIIFKYIRQKAFVFPTVEWLIIFEICAFYYFLMLIAYKDLFRLYHPESIYTNFIIADIDIHKRYVKHVGYLLMYTYLIVFAFLPFFVLEETHLFFRLIAILGFLDLIWVILIKYNLRHISDLTQQDDVVSFRKYLRQWRNGDIAFLFSGIGVSFLLYVPGFEAIIAVLIGACLFLLVLFGFLPVFTERP